MCARTDPWFRGQTLLVPGHGGGGTEVSSATAREACNCGLSDCSSVMVIVSPLTPREFGSGTELNAPPFPFNPILTTAFAAVPLPPFGVFTAFRYTRSAGSSGPSSVPRTASAPQAHATSVPQAQQAPQRTMDYKARRSHGLRSPPYTHPFLTAGPFMPLTVYIGFLLALVGAAWAHHWQYHAVPLSDDDRPLRANWWFGIAAAVTLGPQALPPLDAVRPAMAALPTPDLVRDAETLLENALPTENKEVCVLLLHLGDGSYAWLSFKSLKELSDNSSGQPPGWDAMGWHGVGLDGPCGPMWHGHRRHHGGHSRCHHQSP